MKARKQEAGMKDFVRKGETFLDNILEKRKHRRNTWDNARFLLADLPLDKRAVKKILPLGMWTGPDPKATLFICHYPEVSYPLFPYHEAAMLVHVRTPLGRGLHCCWMIVDDDTALALGREMLGYPKKMGAFCFDEQEKEIRASVVRRGTRVMEMTARRGASQDPAPPVFNHKTFNTGALGQCVALNPVWMFRPREVIRESYEAVVQLTLEDSVFDPLARLAAGGPSNGRIVILNIPGDSPYMLPVGVAGPLVFNRTFNMRFR
jgi:acetoacetate decarboxylase